MFTTRAPWHAAVQARGTGREGLMCTSPVPISQSHCRPPRAGRTSLLLPHSAAMPWPPAVARDEAQAGQEEDPGASAVRGAGPGHPQASGPPGTSAVRGAGVGTHNPVTPKASAVRGAGLGSPGMGSGSSTDPATSPPISSSARAWLGPTEAASPGRGALQQGPLILGSTDDFHRPWNTTNRLLFNDV